MSNGPTKLFIYLLCIISLHSCNGWDDDYRYALGTQAGIFVTFDSTTGERSLTRLENNLIIPNWNNSLGISNAELGDFILTGQYGWISVPSINTVFVVYLRDGKQAKSIDFDSIAPHFLIWGNDYLMVTDTISTNIGFYRHKNGDFYSMKTDSIPGRGVYLGGKFYIQQGCCGISVMNEKALTITNSFSFDNPIDDIQIRSSDIVIITKDGANNYFRSNVGWNGDILKPDEQAVNYVKIRYSPWIKKSFGNEYLSSLDLNQSGNISNMVNNATDFEADFFEGILHYISSDSLVLFDLNTAQELSRIPFPYGLEKGYFYIDTDEAL